MSFAKTEKKQIKQEKKPEKDNSKRLSIEQQQIIKTSLENMQRYNRHQLYKRDWEKLKKLGFTYEDFKKILVIQSYWQVRVMKVVFYKAMKLNKEL